MRLFVLLLLLALSTQAYTQDKAYAREVLETLCAPDFHGRGYFKKGDSLAADYIGREFVKHGLQPFVTTNDESTSTFEQYFQEFRHSVNAQDGELSLYLGKRELVPGQDYLIDPFSPAYFGSGKLLVLSKEEHTSVEAFSKKVKDFKGRFVVIDPTYMEGESDEVKEQFKEMTAFLKWNGELDLSGVIELVPEKLTWYPGSETAPRPTILLLKKVFQEAKAKSGTAYRLGVDCTYTDRYSTNNVVGYIEGQVKDTFVCVIAHYDHLGRMGREVYFPGANDNASGVAMMLSLAKYYGALETPPPYSMVFIAFGAEEIGLVGSHYFVNHPPFPLKNIKFLLNLDILGTGDDGIQVVNGKVHTEAFKRLQDLNEGEEDTLLAQVKTRGAACNSDHCFFHEEKVPSFFIYTLGGVRHYHDIYDKAETLPLTEFEDLFILLTRFIAGI